MKIRGVIIVDQYIINLGTVGNITRNIGVQNGVRLSNDSYCNFCARAQKIRVACANFENT